MTRRRRNPRRNISTSNGTRQPTYPSTALNSPLTCCGLQSARTGPYSASYEGTVGAHPQSSERPVPPSIEDHPHRPSKMVSLSMLFRSHRQPSTMPRTVVPVLPPLAALDRPPPPPPPPNDTAVVPTQPSRKLSSRRGRTRSDQQANPVPRPPLLGARRTKRHKHPSNAKPTSDSPASRRPGAESPRTRSRPGRRRRMPRVQSPRLGSVSGLVRTVVSALVYAMPDRSVVLLARVLPAAFRPYSSIPPFRFHQA